MLGMSLSIGSMVIVLLFVKNKFLIFCFWVLFCFLPFSSFVYDGESSTLDYAYEMGTKEVIEVWFGIVFASFAWALFFFVVALGIYLAIKILSFGIKFLYKKYHQ